MPASSGDQAMKVSLFLCGSQLVCALHSKQDKDLPVTLARCQGVLEVIDSITGALALSTLGNHQ